MLDFENMPFFVCLVGVFFCFFFILAILHFSNMTYFRIDYSKQVVVFSQN